MIGHDTHIVASDWLVISMMMNEIFVAQISRSSWISRADGWD